MQEIKITLSLTYNNKEYKYEDIFCCGKKHIIRTRRENNFRVKYIAKDIPASTKLLIYEMLQDIDDRAEIIIDWTDASQNILQQLAD